jgi:hypothetical protein
MTRLRRGGGVWSSLRDVLVVGVVVALAAAGVAFARASSLHVKVSTSNVKLGKTYRLTVTGFVGSPSELFLLFASTQACASTASAESKKVNPEVSQNESKGPLFYRTSLTPPTWSVPGTYHWCAYLTHFNHAYGKTTAHSSATVHLHH